MSAKPNIIVIVGPTASGKTGLSIKLAKKYNGEIISADSRQVFKGLDIGSGKVTKKEMSGVKHYMLDIASPKKLYSADAYKKDAQLALEKIISKNKTPIICGGTGFYIDALIYNKVFPDVPINLEFRKKLDKYSTEKLFAKLLKKDPERAKNIDKQNRVRLVRALEIVESLGKVPSLPQINSADSKYNYLMIGIKTDQKVLEDKIKKRLLSRIKSGMIKEAENLHTQGLSWKRMEELGLEYRYMSRYLRGLISKEEMVAELYLEICKYSKRQMTWFKANKEIKWFEVSSPKIQTTVKKFLSKNC